MSLNLVAKSSSRALFVSATWVESSAMSSCSLRTSLISPHTNKRRSHNTFIMAKDILFQRVIWNGSLWRNNNWTCRRVGLDWPLKHRVATVFTLGGGSRCYGGAAVPKAWKNTVHLMARASSCQTAETNHLIDPTPSRLKSHRAAAGKRLRLTR